MFGCNFYSYLSLPFLYEAWSMTTGENPLALTGPH